MSVDLTKGATVELVKRLSDDLRTRDGNTKYSSAGAAMRDKANVDGYYEGLTSGTTEQIASSIYEEDNTPYIFRTAGGSVDIGDKEEDTIIGGTIAWNQLCPIPTNDLSGTRPNGSVVTDNRDGTYVVTASAPLTGVDYVWIRNKSSIPNYIKSNHVYLQTSNSSSTGIGGTQFVLYGTTNIAYSEENLPIFKTGNVNDYTEYAFVLYFKTGSQPNNVKLSPCLFDLTQMFGSTIADYVLALEQTTAGAGVAWFKKLFNKPLYPYNEGKLKSVEGLLSHDMVGFNAIKVEECYKPEQMSLNGTTLTNLVTDSRTVFQPAIVGYKSNNQVSGVPAITTKTVGGRYCVLFNSGNYADAAVLRFKHNGASLDIQILNIPYDTLVKNTVYCISMTFEKNNPSTVGGLVISDINVNISWDGERDGEYEPYVKHSYPLDSSLVLRGIFKLDENNKLRCDGDVYHADGTVERKYGIVDLGTLTWTYSNNYFRTNYFMSKVKTPSSQNDSANMICSKLICVPWNDSTTDNSFSVAGTGQFAAKALSYEGDAAAFKTAISGVYLVYELATLTTETALPYAKNQTVNDFGTEEYVSETNMIPVGHETKYQANLKAKLEMAPDSPSDNGDYIVRHTNGKNEYVPLVIPTELPAMPTDNGTYRLKVTVSNGTATLAWESAS